MKVRFTLTKCWTIKFTFVKLKVVSTENGTQTVRRFLSAYEIGRKLSQLRLKKKLSLIDLGKHSGLSASMLSQLENGKLIPTLPTLSRIAMVFDVGLDYFFADPYRYKLFSIVRAGERMRFPERAGEPVPAYYFEHLNFHVQDKSMQCFLAEFPLLKAKSVRTHFHEGAEFLYVLAGQVAIRYRDEEHLLSIGDSVYFDSSEEHGYRGTSPETARAIVVVTPPRT
jgi:transcriptional regulator with XRE-family HTH domain